MASPGLTQAYFGGKLIIGTDGIIIRKTRGYTAKNENTRQTDKAGHIHTKEQRLRNIFATRTWIVNHIP